ncbi:MAG: hypothetical protein PQ612_07380 [Rickettsiales bacterium]|nr:hypothetical protein [Pseudomonadota bacterium]MDA0965712.1 hypothetical protein [Pseudomonadota bacterium]MDG4543826.1 hypothetical protein [Rickettsiales bacterium]MDG4545973.1 hypothetical protein [Rickettsiales bacterium]MDG4548219.1 hypothetical protein [Rickettsiales bacterium]
MKIKAMLMVFLLSATVSVLPSVSNAKENNKELVNLMSALNDKLNTIEDKENISIIAEKGGDFTIKTPIISYFDDIGEKKYLGIIFLKKDAAKQFSSESRGINFSNTKNSKFNKNVVATTNDSFEIELRYLQNPGESDEIMLWGKPVTIIFY